MATIRQKKLAENVGKCGSMKDAMVKAKYSASYAENGNIKNTKGYQETMKPILDRYMEEEKRLMEAMEEKDLTKEEYETLSRSAERARKQIQLIGGGDTERQKIIVVSEESQQRYDTPQDTEESSS